MWEITGTTRLAGLLGSPIAHSISPLMHNFSFQYLGIDCTYLAFDINEQTLKEAVNGLPDFDVAMFWECRGRENLYTVKKFITISADEVKALLK